MQKREPSKAASSGPTPPKRGRPFGSTAANSAAAAAAAAAVGDSSVPASLFGPSLQLPASFADQNNKRIVLALQSGLKSELTWALNTLTLLSFKEKDDMRRDAVPLAKIPGLLDALLQIIDDWRDIAVPKEYAKRPRTRLLGANTVVTGFGYEYEMANSKTAPPNTGSGVGLSYTESSARKGLKRQSLEWWFDEDGLFNLDEEGAQKNSNVLLLPQI
ncbi:hypothetical protein J5N97_017572 [Dioscorea zingiberensis]|uniref:Uncharacterized protein n=1 Tax=Dioscorea zingiberensis TaxID=325984 RepID=A0A9D5CM85_9LILI|nr:hypothetical protein J5N97_017572 [Dioscorea zingiberensis]